MQSQSHREESLSNHEGRSFLNKIYVIFVHKNGFWLTPFGHKSVLTGRYLTAKNGLLHFYMTLFSLLFGYVANIAPREGRRGKGGGYSELYNIK